MQLAVAITAAEGVQEPRDAPRGLVLHADVAIVAAAWFAALTMVACHPNKPFVVNVCHLRWTNQSQKQQTTQTKPTWAQAAIPSGGHGRGATRYPSTAKVWQTLNTGKAPRIPNNLIISGAAHGQMRGHCLGVVCQTLPVQTLFQRRVSIRNMQL